MARRRTLGETAPTVNANQAFNVAQQFILSIYPHATELRLEEIEAPSDMASHGTWKVTVGFFDAAASYPPGSLGAIGGFRTRIYKALEIDARTGVVKRMKIRAAPAAS